MAQHTPAPWTVGPGKGNHIAVAARHWDAPLVSNVCAAGRSAEECEANARLISAAPDMLAALKLQREAQAHAQAASDATSDGQVIPKVIHDEVAAWFARAEKAAFAAIAKAEGR